MKIVLNSFIASFIILVTVIGCGDKNPDTPLNITPETPTPDEKTVNNLEGMTDLDQNQLISETQRLREEELARQKEQPKEEPDDSLTQEVNTSETVYLQSPDEIINLENNTSQPTEGLEEIKSQIQSVYFDFDKFSIREDMLNTVNSNVKLMNSKTAVAYNVLVEGNCDEWGTDEYNYALGLKRAQIIKEALIAEGLAENRISVLSYGEANPVCLEYKDECWAKNRRTDFLLHQQ